VTVRARKQYGVGTLSAKNAGKLHIFGADDAALCGESTPVLFRRQIEQRVSTLADAVELLQASGRHCSKCLQRAARGN
jgi:hypothetical protein